MDFKNLYNIKSLNAFCDSSKSKSFTDSASGVVLARQLEMIDPTIFEVQYPELALMTTGLSINNAGGVAEIISSLRRRTQGTFTVAGDSSTDKGKITRTMEKSYINVIEGQAHSSWTDTDIQRAKEGNENLPATFISGANEIYQREVDEMGLVGNFGNTGLLNNTDFTASAATGTLATLLATSAQTVYDEVVSWIQAQWNGVNNIPGLMADVMLLPVSSMNLLSGAILNSAAGEASILTALKRNYPGIKFVSSHRAESVSGSSRAVIFSTGANASVMRIPMPLQVSEIIKTGGWDYKVDYRYRIAGIDILEAASGIIKTGL